MKLKEFTATTFNTKDAQRLWTEINHVSFDGALEEPLMILMEPDLSHLVDQRYADHKGGQAVGYVDEDPDTGHFVIILWDGFEDPREFMSVVAHEMVHQAIAQKLGYKEMCKAGHGPLFKAYAPKIKRYHHLDLLSDSY